MSIKNTLKRALPQGLQHRLRRLRGTDLSQQSYAQEGEDILLASLLEPDKRQPGFFVDVGAYHPINFSNTYLFYRRGWRGINLDPRPGSMQDFNAIRPGDRNLEMAVSRTREKLNYYEFNIAAYNGFSKELSESRDGVNDLRLVRTIPVATAPLSEILREHVPAGRQIDFMSVDVEGLDLEVLQSNDWNAFRPTVILAEDFTAGLCSGALKCPITQFLDSCGYDLCCKGRLTMFFVRRDCLEINPEGIRLRP